MNTNFFCEWFGVWRGCLFICFVVERQVILTFFCCNCVVCVCVCLWARPGNFLVVGCCRKEAEAGVNEMAKNEREKMKREESVGARYVTALRANLLTKLNKKGLHVPNLCACVPPSSTCH